MKTEITQATTIRAFDIANLDPITITMVDTEPSKGRITLSCFDKSWTAYWGGMNNRTVGQFFVDCDEHYLASSLSNCGQHVVDFDEITKQATAIVLRDRRSKEISAEQAIALMHEIQHELLDDEKISPIVATKIFGDDWYFGLPKKINPEYAYLCRVIKAAKEGISGYLELQESTETQEATSRNSPRG